MHERLVIVRAPARHLGRGRDQARAGLRIHHVTLDEEPVAPIGGSAPSGSLRNCTPILPPFVPAI
jgi:hypothetical protein